MNLLDLFCSAGGSAVGYHRAGFEVVGVDIEPQPHYPFAFVQMDALDALHVLLDGGFITDNRGHKWYLRDFDAVHASPPCQGYSRLAKITKTADRYPKLIERLRPLLIEAGIPFVLENVIGAPLINPLKLCGTMFGLKVIRHRLFEIHPPLYFLPAPCNHHSHTRPTGNGNMTMGYYNHGEYGLVTIAGHTFTRAVGARAMGIDWMTRDELCEAIPPAYTEFIGRQLREALI